MKLTKTMRETFIEAVMADVPFIDYEQQIEAAVRQEYIDRLPPAVRRVWDDSALRPYIETPGVNLPNYKGERLFTSYVYVPCLSDDAREYNASKKVLELLELNYQQRTKMKELRAMLYNTARAYTTDVKLREALPEFAKYVPCDAPTDRTVPALTGVVGAFRDAGWPADKK